MRDRSHRFVAYLVLVSLVAAAVGCGSDDSGDSGPSASGKQLSVGTTVAPITSIVAEHRRRSR